MSLFNRIFLCVLVIFCLCSGISSIISIKRLKEKYNKKKSGCLLEKTDEETKGSHITIGEVYREIITIVIFSSITILILIEIFCRIPQLENVRSSFDTGTTVQIIVGIMGAAATVMLGCITIAFSKEESLHNEEMQKILNKENQEKINIMRKESEVYINGLMSEYNLRLQETINEIRKKSRNQLIKLALDYFYGFESTICYMYDIRIQSSESEIYSLFPISKFIDRDKKEICLLLKPKVTCPIISSIRLTDIHIQFLNGQTLEMKDDKNNYSSIVHDSLSIYFPIGISGINNLINFQKGKYHFAEEYRKCTFCLKFELNDEAIVDDGYVRQKVKVSFKLQQLYTQRTKYMPEFRIENVEIETGV